MMYRLALQKSLTVSGVSGCNDISHVSTDRVWISDYGNLILTNTKGEELDYVTDIGRVGGGHTVNRECDLIYIDREYNINKLSTDYKEKTTIIKYNTAPWRPECVYSSPSTGDLLVGMRYTDTLPSTGKVVRYNSTRENIQTIQHDNNTGQELYSNPIYITENRNGDVIVSDLWCAVVVTDRDGNYRFSYTGHPSGSGLWPRGICTDALSHILLCDHWIHSVQMLNSDGHYLTEIKTSQHGIDRPVGLSYDVDTHLLWVGSDDNNTVSIYRVVDICTDSLTGLPLEDFKCRKHPSRPLSQFCIPCDVTLCIMCILTSGEHKKHDVRNVEKLFREIHEEKDGDAVLICLLLCPSYKINLEEEQWIEKYNAVAEFFIFKKIKEPSNLSNLKKYKPIIKQDGVNLEFSCEFFRDTSFLRLAKNPHFVNGFLTLAEKDNIAKYCRSWAYPKKEGEVFCWLSPHHTKQLIEKLGEDIFIHPTWQDTSIHEDVFHNLGVPMQILMRGEESVKNFTENLKKGKTTMYHASGMIIGCAGSGKSTLLERLKGINLEEILKNLTSTRGIDVQSDIFDVTHTTIRVNTSNQRQRFKVKIDESSKQKTISKQTAKVSGDIKKLAITETGDQMDAASITNKEESVSDTEFPPENLNTESESLKGNEAAALVDEGEMIEDKEMVPENSEISGTLRVSKDVFDDLEKKITMVDFAGQCSYYASHQIFLSPRAFFILVLNMDKKFDEKVGKEVCRQEGSIYEGWTHKDYLTFWAKSIHQYSSEKAPVLLVGTHAERKTKEEKEKFFREIWTTLETKDASLQRHFDRKRMFAVGFHENECIAKIKLSVVDVVKNLDHWGEKLPYSWAMFENFFQEKKNLKIINKETLLAFNEALPQEMKLETVEDIHTMLQFFHDIREILHFNQESLRGIIILDVQWFADAFKNVITDKNHAAEDLFKLASQWNKFNETGVLSDTLLSAIWEMNSNGYLEHKDDIMRYMEKLGLLAKMEDNNWYVPCMNKRSFPVRSFSSYPASSILCYIFDVLPAGIFQRLVAICVQFPWKIVKVNEDGKEQPCIYQTAAVFLFEKHCVLLGMTQSEIQLQVYVIEGEVEIPTCIKIRQKIEDELHTLSSTFQRNLKFQIGFKCKPIGLCDIKKSHVIKESELTEPTLLCPSCPMDKKHNIDTTEILKYWKQMKTSASTTPIASGQDLGDQSRYAKLGMATNDVLNQAYRDILEMEVPPSNIENTVKASPVYKKLRPEQEHTLQDAKNSGYKNFDISLTYTMIRNICKKVPKPTKRKWGNEPAAGEVTVGDDVERIRSIRNGLTAHVSSASTSKSEFQKTWSIISDICQRLEIYTGKKYLDDLSKIQKMTLRMEDENAIIEKIKMESQHKMVKKLCSDMEDVKAAVERLEMKHASN